MHVGIHIRILRGPLKHIPTSKYLLFLNKNRKLILKAIPEFPCHGNAGLSRSMKIAIRAGRKITPPNAS